MKALPEITTGIKKEALHAQIKTLWFKDGKCLVDDEAITVHFSQSDPMYRCGVIGIEIDGLTAYVSIDALLSTIYTAYDPSLLKKSVYFWEHLWMRVMSFFIRLKK